MNWTNYVCSIIPMILGIILGSIFASNHNFDAFQTTVVQALFVIAFTVIKTLEEVITFVRKKE
jgi:hypothetical protein